jgi:hypothetical protein
MEAPIESDVELTEEEVDEEEESEEETYIEALTREVVSEHEETVADYAEDPETPEELAKNEAIKKFLIQKVRNKLLDSFEDQLKWIDDADLVAMVRKWKKLTAKDDIDDSTAMKRIIKENAVIVEVVEQQLEEMLEDEEEPEENEDDA